MKSLSKRIAILIVVLVLAVSGAVVGVLGAQALEPKPDVEIMVISDTHVFSDEHVGNLCDDFLTFDAARTGRVQYLTESVFRNSLNYIKKQSPDALLITGDLVDTATKFTHQEVANYLKEVEANGIDVFVVPGNHDISSSAPSFENGYRETVDAVNYDEFKEIYYDFGWDGAVKTDDKSISYAADLGDKYRVISIDATRAKADLSLSPDLIEWTKQAIEETIADGRIPIGITHYSMVIHFGEITAMFASEKSYINDVDNFRSTVMEAGLEYVFTGHMHANDIASYTDEEGRTLYDIETSSLAAAPSPIRTVKCFGTEFHFSTSNLPALAEDTLPDYLPADEREAVLADYQTYARRGVEKDMRENLFYGKKLAGYVDMIIGAFDIDTTTTGAKILSNDFCAMVEDILDMPLYGANSVESVCESYGVEFPVVNAATAGEFIFNFVAEWFGGDENLELNSAEDLALRYVVYAALDKVADFDLFGRLNALNPNVKVVDLKPAMQQLFTSQKLDVVKNNLIGNVLNSVPAIKDSAIGGIANAGSQSIITAIATILPSINLYGLDLDGVIDAQAGAIDFGAIFDLAVEDIGIGILTDFSEADNNTILNEQE
ncbi:MAG: metallophosphoesterase [Clostridia bacterium]|nr:metallophosphoesterase [Clostridia bacterium]